MEYSVTKLLEAFARYGIKAIFLGAVILCAVLLGKTLRKKKDEKDERDEKNAENEA